MKKLDEVLGIMVLVMLCASFSCWAFVGESIFTYIEQTIGTVVAKLYAVMTLIVAIRVLFSMKRD